MSNQARRPPRNRRPQTRWTKFKKWLGSLNKGLLSVSATIGAVVVIFTAVAAVLHFVHRHPKPSQAVVAACGQPREAMDALAAAFQGRDQFPADFSSEAKQWNSAANGSGDSQLAALGEEASNRLVQYASSISGGGRTTDLGGFVDATHRYMDRCQKLGVQLAKSSAAAQNAQLCQGLPTFAADLERKLSPKPPLNIQKTLLLDWLNLENLAVQPHLDPELVLDNLFILHFDKTGAVYLRDAWNRCEALGQSIGPLPAFLASS